MPQNPPLEQVLVECAIFVGKGIGNVDVDQAAMAHWASVYVTTIKAALPNGDWKVDRVNVLKQALKLGKAAAAVADPNAPINLDNAKSASAAIKEDPSCPNQPGGGKYCA